MSKAAKTEKQVTSADLLALLKAGQFDESTAKVLSKALTSDPDRLPLEVLPPKGKMPALVKVGSYDAKNFAFKPKGLSPRLVRAVVAECETAEGRKRILSICEQADDAKPEK